MKSPRIVEYVLKFGTPEQIADIEHYLATVEAKKHKSNEAVKQYAKRIFQKNEASGKGKHLKAIDFINARILKKMEAAPGIEYEAVRSLFWKAYKAIVKREQKIELNPDSIRQDKQLSEAMKNICHWIIKSDQGKYPPHKSLFIYGNVGVGKSTLAEATLHTIKAINEYYDDSIDISYTSMNQVFVGMQSGSRNQDELLIGNLILDEVKQEHAKYKDYGNDIDLVSSIIFARHDLWKVANKRTLITTNMNAPDFAEQICSTDEDAERLASRMRQEYYFELIQGQDKRNPKFRL